MLILFKIKLFCKGKVQKSSVHFFMILAVLYFCAGTERIRGPALMMLIWIMLLHSILSNWFLNVNFKSFKSGYLIHNDIRINCNDQYMVSIGILKENSSENRVALLPEDVASVVKLNVEVWVEPGAGTRAFASDMEYIQAGARIMQRQEILTGASLLLMVQPITISELQLLKEGQIVIGMMNPFFAKDIVDVLCDRSITSFSLELVPRTTRAQAMDVLSSMATVAGYKAVLYAATVAPRFFPMLMTAAGTIRPAKVLILGAGVAGLQAVAMARKLGAVVEVFDVRKAVKEEVQSLGARFVEVEGARDEASAGGYAVEQSDEFKKMQEQKIHEHAVKSNVLICTAQIQGRQAPVLIKKDTVEAMMPGSVIVDIAASTGGNCELTKDNETIQINGITIIGNSNYPSQMPNDASRMFGKNLINFIKLLIDKEGKLQVNLDDDIVRGTCLTHKHEVINERVKRAYEL